MSDLVLTKIRMRHGVWEGRITGTDNSGMPPMIGVRYLDKLVEDVKVMANAEGTHWDIAVRVPAEAVSDGVHSFLIMDESDDTKLGDFTLIAGETLTDDFRAEVELLRAELDMLKRAFRRHCLETM